MSGGIRREDQEERRRNGCGEIGSPPEVYIYSSLYCGGYIELGKQPMIGSDGEGKRKEAISPKEREPNRQQKVNCDGVRSTKRKKERRKGKQKKERERQSVITK